MHRPRAEVGPLTAAQNGTEPPDAPDEDTPSAFARLDSAEGEVRVRRAMAALPAEQQAVLKHAYWDEEAHGAIASSLGIPLGTVKSRLRLALTRLRAAMEEAQ